MATHRVFDSEASMAQLIVGLTPALARALARGERTRDTTRLRDITAQARVELRPQTARDLSTRSTPNPTVTGPATPTRADGVVLHRDGRRRPPGRPRRSAAPDPRGDRRVRHAGPGTAVSHPTKFSASLRYFAGTPIKPHPNTPRRIGCHPGSARPTSSKTAAKTAAKRDPAGAHVHRHRVALRRTGAHRRRRPRRRAAYRHGRRRVGRGRRHPGPQPRRRPAPP